MGVPAEPGVYAVTTPNGGSWQTTDGGGRWTPVDRTSAPAAPDPHRWIDPDNPRRIARTESGGIAVTVDGGEHWVPSHHLPIAEIASLTPRSTPLESATARRMIAGAPAHVSVADRARAGLIFAATDDGVYVSFDAGAAWTSLRLNLPDVRVNDLDIRGNDLVAATQGRSTWLLEDISPLRQLGATVASATMLFKPAASTLSDPGVYLDYYLATPAQGAVTLDVVDLSSRVVHAAASAPADPHDLWLAVSRPLPTSAGHHRVRWTLRLDPPPAQNHRYARLASALFLDMPADPDGPHVLAGTYRVRLTVDGRVYSQALTVSNDPRVSASPSALAALRRRFDLAMKMYDAMQIAHRQFLALARVRAQLQPALASADAPLAQLAADLDGRLAQIDGSDWTGLVIPDADDEIWDEGEETEGVKHPDFKPPKPVSVSKDYDDPTSILGRKFANVDHPPAFATMSVALGTMLRKLEVSQAAPDSLTLSDYQRACGQLADVVATWRSINVTDLPHANIELTTRGLPPLPVAAAVPTLSCGVRQP